MGEELERQVQDRVKAAPSSGSQRHDVVLAVDPDG